MANWNGFEYEIVEGEITITGYNGSEINITLPETIEGHPVTVIDDGAFAGKTLNFHELVIHRSIRRVGAGAFYFNNINNIYVKNAVVVLGEWALATDKNI